MHTAHVWAATLVALALPSVAYAQAPSGEPQGGGEPQIVFDGSGAAPAAPAPAPASAPASPALASASLSASPSADRPSEPGANGNELGHKQSFWRLAIGPRFEYVRDPGFDAFGDSDVLAAWSMEATRTILARGRFSFGAGLGTDLGGRSGHARGMESGLFVARFSAPLEGRYHVLPWLYGFARVAPGAAYVNARVDDPSSPGALTKSGGMFTADFSGGASVLLGPQGKAKDKTVRFWITPEVGYAWSTAMALDMTAEGHADDPRPQGTTSLGELALRGPFFRVSAALTF